MRRSVVRQLLPLAVVCLLAVQVAASARGGAGRLLKAAPRGDPILPTRIQFVQVRPPGSSTECISHGLMLVRWLFDLTHTLLSKGPFLYLNNSASTLKSHVLCTLGKLACIIINHTLLVCALPCRLPGH
jgi:hypothetical protein